MISNVLVVFVLSLLGNIIVRQVHLSTPLAGVLAIACLALQVVGNLALYRIQGNRNALPTIFGPLDLRRVGSIFPASLGVGAGVSILSALWHQPHRVFATVSFVGLRLWNYEVWAFLLGVAAVFLFSLLYRGEKMLVFVFGVGCALGAATTLVILYPHQNVPIWSFFWWLTTVLVATVFVVSLRSLILRQI
jgi:hypothetical protein